MTRPDTPPAANAVLDRLQSRLQSLRARRQLLNEMESDDIETHVPINPVEHK
jgi:hypothetical protein